MSLTGCCGHRLGGAMLLALTLLACGEEPSPLPPVPLRGGEMVCREGACTQRFPALPDDGEWECVERSGAVICRGGHGPAGVIAGPSDPGFVCGALRGDEEARRICVDAAPDRPSPEGWRCRFEREGATEIRRCERGEALGVGAPCGECPEGLSCEAGRCALRDDAPPDCWVDGDCPGGACVLARCRAR